MLETLAISGELTGPLLSIPEAAGSLSLVPFTFEPVSEEGNLNHEPKKLKTEVIMMANPWQVKNQIKGQLVILPLADCRDQWKVVVH